MVWRNAVWGRKFLNVFGWFDGWGYRHNYLDERYCELGPTLGPTGALLREAGTAIPVGKKRAWEFGAILHETEILKPRIAAIVPGTSQINEYPYHHPNAAYSTVNIELVRFERFLTPRDFDFRFVPEEVILNGQEDLSGFRAIILPYATYFPKGLAEKLLAWTKAGGTLIASGVPGVYDAYGFEDPALVRGVFGKALQWRYAGDNDVWRWELTVAEGDTSIEVLGGPGAFLVAKALAKGRMLISATPFTDGPNQRKLQAVLADALERAIGRPAASGDRHRFEMVTRADANGQRYLFITNPALRAAAMDYVTVDGVYKQIIDLGVGSHCTVPLAPRVPMAVNSRHYTTSEHTDGTGFIAVSSPPGCTTFQMRLAPGEATVLKLVK